MGGGGQERNVAACKEHQLRPTQQQFYNVTHYLIAWEEGPPPFRGEKYKREKENTSHGHHKTQPKVTTTP
jgi:5'-3' exonuclease